MSFDRVLSKNVIPKTFPTVIEDFRQSCVTWDINHNRYNYRKKHFLNYLLLCFYPTMLCKNAHIDKIIPPKGVISPNGFHLVIDKKSKGR